MLTIQNKLKCLNLPGTAVCIVNATSPASSARHLLGKKKEGKSGMWISAPVV